MFYIFPSQSRWSITALSGDHSLLLVQKLPKVGLCFGASTVLGTQMLSKCPVEQGTQLVLGVAESRNDYIGATGGAARTHSRAPAHSPPLALPTAMSVFWPKLFPNPEHVLSSLFLYFKVSLQHLNLCSACPPLGAFLEKPTPQCINNTAALTLRSPYHHHWPGKAGPCVLHQVDHQSLWGQDQN